MISAGGPDPFQNLVGSTTLGSVPLLFPHGKVSVAHHQISEAIRSQAKRSSYETARIKGVKWGPKWRTSRV